MLRSAVKKEAKKNCKKKKGEEERTSGERTKSNAISIHLPSYLLPHKNTHIDDFNGQPTTTTKDTNTAS
jgi:hypothetical protein